MLNLKRLCIKTKTIFTIAYRQFQALLYSPKLESLKLTAVIAWDDCLKDSNIGESKICTLNEFNLLTIDAHKWISSSVLCFAHFKYLTALKLRFTVEVTEDLLSTIAENCSRLKTWRFESTLFSNINIFPVPTSVEEFSLLLCAGLTYDNLKQLLTLYHITKFYSSLTCYNEEFEDFSISPQIETLHIVNNFDTIRHVSAYRENTNLKELSWWHSLPDTCITPTVPLKDCSNLHTLVLMNCHFDLKTLLELKLLRNLKMPHPIPLLGWSFITQLLEQHPSLQELGIQKYYGKGYRKIQFCGLDKPGSINVHRIEIPFDILNLGLNYWLDLLSENKSLKIICWTYQLYERLGQAIGNIVRHRNFTKSKACIDMCGFHTGM